MSTYVRLACLDHDPVLRAANESDQHAMADGVMDRIRGWVEQRDRLLEAWVEADFDLGDRYLNNSLTFLTAHRACRIAAETEYGDWFDLGQGIPGPAPECTSSWGFDVDFDVSCSLTGRHGQHLAKVVGNDGIESTITWRNPR